VKSAIPYISRHATLAERLLPRINIVALDDFDVCWTWSRGKRGKDPAHAYGGLSLGPGRKHELAHRAMWELTWGRRVPAGKFVCHTCDNPACCRPSHLYLGTPADNMRDKTVRGRGRQPCGEQHCQAKLTNDQVLTIRATVGYRIVSKLARQYGVTPSVIRHIQRRTTWKHLP
jgi:hypothetical protein